MSVSGAPRPLGGRSVEAFDAAQVSGAMARRLEMSQLTPDERRRLILLKQEYDWRLWSVSERDFILHACKIRHPERGLIPFELREAQSEALEVWTKRRYSLTLKARQIGWSTLAAAHVLWLAFFAPDREIILISRTEREAVDLLRKVKVAYQNLPQWLRERGPQLTSDHQQKMPFSNGSGIISMPSAADPARGSSAYLVVVDEWAFLNDGEKAWASIEPVANVGGRVIGLSTANGIDNFFYHLWTGAQTGEPPGARFHTMFHSWRAGGRDDAWYEVQKASMLPWQLAQEYPDTAEEAFVRSGRPIFDIDAIKRYEIIQPELGYLEGVAAA